MGAHRGRPRHAEIHWRSHGRKSRRNQDRARNRARSLAHQNVLSRPWFFPNERRPRVLWAGIEASAELSALAAAIENALELLGVAREQRAFSPHLTLARFDSPRGLERLHAAVSEAGGLEFGRSIASEFHLYQSVLKRGGAEYTRLASYRFAEDESR